MNAPGGVGDGLCSETIVGVHHRCHTALGGDPPICRVNNAAGRYSYGVVVVVR